MSKLNPIDKDGARPSGRRNAAYPGDSKTGGERGSEKRNLNRNRAGGDPRGKVASETPKKRST